jgi:hypothetical protein
MTTLQNPQSFSQKVNRGADRMAQRMGGQFVQNSRWETVVTASSVAPKIGPVVGNKFVKID